MAAAMLAAVLALTACTSPADPPPPGQPHTDGPGFTAIPGVPTEPAFAPAEPTGTGLAASVAGYTLVPGADTVPANAPSTLDFHITGPDGRAVVRYQPYEGELLVCYVVRSDLTGFHRLAAAMRQDGTWTATVPALPAGAYRAFVSFAAPDSSQGTPLVYNLSRPFMVPGRADTVPLPAPTGTATVDGYTVTLAGQGSTGRTVPLTVTIAHGGRPVESFTRYLDGYAHLTGFHVGDLALARFLSIGAVGPAGALTAQATFPVKGTWRVFTQFDLAGAVHTAAFTITVS
jgi:hypothetical protein